MAVGIEKATEEKLRGLFEVNMILSNPRIDAMIEETMERVESASKNQSGSSFPGLKLVPQDTASEDSDRIELSDEDAEMLAAAGDVKAMELNASVKKIKRIIVEP